MNVEDVFLFGFYTVHKLGVPRYSRGFYHPGQTYSGTCTTKPVVRVAGLVRALADAPRLPAAVDLGSLKRRRLSSASASARTKPATLTTGLVVQVPEYVAPGDKIRVNTAEHKL